MSFRDLPLLYETIGGSLNISLSRGNNGDNNGVTGLHNSYPRVIATLEFGSNECVFLGSAPFV